MPPWRVRPGVFEDDGPSVLFDANVGELLNTPDPTIVLDVWLLCRRFVEDDVVCRLEAEVLLDEDAVGASVLRTGSPVTAV